ncbi:hypothetical protein [Thioclava sp. FTW29]|uniref:Chromosome partitioning ATPase, Mrp family, contains Fe-S cluster n=1 Tax=Thioclava litoralis TaxID=3076557 RepID=A0ABZ1E6Q5_9RHOB|nr:hypothetical protein RPE78_16415 [Thioclava sp. FTW29]
MEKLQQALEKARANRATGLAADGRARPNMTAAPTAEAHSAPWLALPEMRLDGKLLKTNRLLLSGNTAESAHFDLLRTRLREEIRRHEARRIAIVSAGPNAGKSTVISNLALSFGRLPFLRTMLFDFDLRHPTLARIFGQSPKSNMGAVINSEVAFADHMMRYGNNLAVGMNNAPVPSSAELLQSDGIEDFLNAVQDAYTPDLMLFDLPPLLVADDAYGFLRHVDGVIMVIEAEVTSKSQIDALEQKLSDQTRLLGVVLNKCNFPDENDPTGYNYGYN